MTQPKPKNLDVTTESESKASEHPHPGDKPESIVEPPPAVTRQEAAKEIKKRKPKK